jgi:glycosyltransferase involved in cell wall biosynthesis
MRKQTFFFFSSLRRGTFSSSLARWLRLHGAFFPMSWEAFAFDRYRRQREEAIPGHFTALHCDTLSGCVSIILPAYNGEDYLREAVDSILAQTYSNWELIAVDDGSTDATGAILDTYAVQDARIRVVHQKNKKLPGALNQGFALARGEYLTWTSCDNRLYPDFLEKMVGSLERRPDWDMVYANVDLIDENGDPLVGSAEFVTYQRPLGSEHIYLPNDPAELNTYPNNFVNSAFLYRKRVYQLLGDYSLHQFTLEDYDYWMRVNALMTLRHVDFPQPVYQYRFHRQSLTAHRGELKILEKRQALMIQDDFRRSFYLSPLIWVVEDHSGTFTEEVTLFKQMIAQAGQVVLSPEQLSRLSIPKGAVPVVNLQFVSDLADFRRQGTELPAACLTLALTSLDKNSSSDMAVYRSQTDRPVFWTEDITTLFSAVDVFVRRILLEGLENRTACCPQAHSIDRQTSLSVVVCTNRVPDQLSTCLKSLARQVDMEEKYEVLVVNNAPELLAIDHCVGEARSQWFSGREDRLRLIHCPLRGLSNARNAGMAVARGEVICFIDDDAEAAPDWLFWIWKAFINHPDVGVIGGKILLDEPKEKPWWYRSSWKRFWSHFDPPYEEFQQVDRWQDYPWGANWTARAAALNSIGGFRSKYGRMGKNLTGGEEIVAASLVQKMGWKVGIEPKAEVIHHVDAARFSLSYLWKSIRASRRSWYQVQRDLYIPRETSLGDILRRIGNAFRSIKAESAVKIFFTLYGEGTLIFWLTKDLVLRLRKPITSR